MYIIRKTFLDVSVFNTLTEANIHLDEVIKKLNSKLLSRVNKSPLELLDEDRAYLLPDIHWSYVNILDTKSQTFHAALLANNSN